MKTLLMLIIGLVSNVYLESEETKAEPTQGFTIHEWGTFTSVQGSDGNLIAWNPFETGELPSFVYDRTRPLSNGNSNSKTFELIRNGSVTAITGKELKLLQCFRQHQGEVLSRDQLLNEVWGYNYSGNTRILDQVVVKLRRLIGEPEGKPQFIITIHGAGYKLVFDQR